MEILYTIKGLGAGVEELAFVLALGVLSFFYTAYKNCEDEIEKENMMERFLNE
jgi:hypothetical protein